MVLKRYAILVIVLIYGIAIATSKELTDHYGLSFHSHEVNQDERTGMILASEQGFNFRHGFSLTLNSHFRKLILLMVMCVVLSLMMWKHWIW